MRLLAVIPALLLPNTILACGLNLPSQKDIITVLVFALVSAIAIPWFFAKKTSTRVTVGFLTFLTMAVIGCFLAFASSL